MYKKSYATYIGASQNYTNIIIPNGNFTKMSIRNCMVQSESTLTETSNVASDNVILRCDKLDDDLQLINLNYPQVVTDIDTKYDIKISGPTKLKFYLRTHSGNLHVMGVSQILYFMVVFE